MAATLAMPGRSVAALMVAALVVAGCAGRNRDEITDPIKLRSISFEMTPNANGNRPARVELVRVDGQKALDQLLRIDTLGWFGEDGEAFRGAHPGAVYDSWELVPGRASGPFDVAARGKLAGVLFCHPGSASSPLRLEPGRRLRVVIDGERCTLDGRSRKSWLTRWLPSRSRTLSFSMDAGTNGNRPVRVALVRVADPALIDDLARLRGRAWFGTPGQEFRRSHPEALYDDWELVPGDAYGPFRLAKKNRTGGVLFCATARGVGLPVDWAGGRRDVKVEIDDEGCRLAAPRRAEWGWNPLTWGGWR